MGNMCMTQKKEKLTVETTAITQTSQNSNNQFTADIPNLHKYYVKITLYVRQTKLFNQLNDKLVNAVKEYFQKSLKSDGQNFDVACVDAVRKLHPHQYWNKKIDEKWLTDACLRQQKFSDQTKVQSITYQHAYPEYLQFLTLCKYNFDKKNNAVSVPTKCQDVIWHSHMQDPLRYKNDMIKYMGKLLNHMDDIPEQILKKHNENTIRLKKQLFNKTNNTFTNTT